MKVLMAVYNPIEIDGRVKRIAGCLADEFDVTLLCPGRSGIPYSAPFKILRVRSRPKAGRIFRQLAFWWHFIANAMAMKPDLVYAHDYFLPFPGWCAAKLVRSRFVYDAHELAVPEEGQRMPLRARFFYALEKLVLPRADLVIAANPERAKIMQEHYHLKMLPTVIRNISPLPENRFSDKDVMKRYPLLARAAGGDMHIVYMGYMCRSRGIGVLLSVADHLPDHFKIIYVGGGPDLDYFITEAEKKPKGRVRVVGEVTHAWVHDILRQADIGFISYPFKGLNNLYCAPNKIFEYAFAGLPVVSTCQPTLSAIVNEYRMGELVGCQGEPAPEEIAEAFKVIASRMDLYKTKIRGLLHSFTWEKESATLLAAVRACLK